MQKTVKASFPVSTVKGATKTDKSRLLITPPIGNGTLDIYFTATKQSDVLVSIAGHTIKVGSVKGPGHPARFFVPMRERSDCEVNLTKGEFLYVVVREGL